jgi:two-component system sensor histidine kinase DesK
VANQEVARLAVAEERARVARDVHDVLGHSLTTVTLKLGLVRRLLETTPEEVERLIVEVGEAEQLSRQALSEVRATLSGYRSASLSAEVAGARAALASAGITADLPRAVDNVLPAYQESFAYVLREGVTNVLRHSGATSCEVRLGESWLEVRDNGRATVADAGASRVDGGGAGLTGLADRLAAIGGRCRAAGSCCEPACRNRCRHERSDHPGEPAGVGLLGRLLHVVHAAGVPGPVRH